ncbi:MULTISPECIES: hypothetical protein [unclassified Desulfosporosinus]|uniref:hypothetical protein n=1 Tax=unclassified Desulfosporosinus TaxID=2633794 RepID=UPI000223A70D|nr:MULTISPECIES: hypothetical protein [unclassified Desulfosporosinus]EGW40513.1 hypothetical protein DOT_1513 [Desulfosporosinus sp. OT]ODA41411.1 hypothetical protein DSBG_1854 [Desulfosporosinus sp. BG]
MDQQQIIKTLAKILEAQNELEKNHNLISKKLDEMNSKQEALSKQLGKIELILESDLFKKITDLKNSHEEQKETTRRVDPLVASGKKFRHFN